MTPDKYTINEIRLNVGDGHTLYVQEWGNKESDRKFLFLHGGPGGRCSDSHRNYFDPATDYVIFFDQRGAGNSTPYGSLHHNTTDDLVGDINKILDELGIDTVTIVGGSWGSTLALAYTLENQSRVKSLILRGIFTGSKEEVDFMDMGGFRHFFPEVWHDFTHSVPEKYKDNPSEYHMENMLNGDNKKKRQSSLAYAKLEGSIASLDDRTNNFEDNFDPVPMCIEIHYTRQLCFMPDNYILENAGKIHVPVRIIQGRYDNVCPPITAWKLHNTLQNSTLLWTQAGHSGSDRANFEAIKQAVLLTN